MGKKFSLEELHKYSFGNKERIERSNKCGCFYCGKIFNSEDVDYFIHEKSGVETAVCPYCGIDSVIGDENKEVEHIEITDELLKNMKNRYF